MSFFKYPSTTNNGGCKVHIYIIFPKRALAGNYNLFYNQPSFGEHWYHLQSIFASSWQTNVDIKMIHKV